MADRVDAGTIADTLYRNHRRTATGPRIPAELVHRLAYDTNLEGIASTIRILARTIQGYECAVITPETPPDFLRIVNAVKKAAQEARFK